MTTNDLRISASTTGGGVPSPDYDVVVVGGGVGQEKHMLETKLKVAAGTLAERGRSQSWR